LLSATNPESGTISYLYDPNGNLIKKTDARGVVTDYVYDALNRVTNRNYSTPGGIPQNYQATPNVTYFYDNVTNAKGKLTKVSSNVSTTEYVSFDILSRVTRSKQTVDGVIYGDDIHPMTYTYNLSGALIEQVYPSGRITTNTLDVDGDLAQVQSKKNASDYFRTYANDFVYAAAGAVLSLKLGNGRFENTQYNSRLQPVQIGLGASASTQNLLKLNFDYGAGDNNGNVKSQTITVPTAGANQGFVATQSYTYDSLNRIKQATEIIASQIDWQQTFRYDRFGNKRFDTANNATTTLIPNCQVAVCNPEIDVSNNRLIGYSFDASGNEKTDASGQTFIYDSENKLVQVNNTAGIVGQYFYNGDGRRVKKIVPSTGETTVFVYDASNKQIAEYSTIVASRQDAKISYLTSDHLGSPRINTDQFGNINARHDYHPFGEEIDGTGGRTTGLGYGDDSVRKKFTSYERDGETNLDFAQARYYANQHGRFTSVDPIMMEKKRLADPQAINLYIYTRNNPLKYVDPDGEKFKGTDGKEVIIEREKVNGTKIWVIKSNNASKDLQKLVSLINASGSKTASAQFNRLNDHATMINLVIDTTTSRSDKEKQGSTTVGLHEPHDKNGPLKYNDATDEFDGKADSSTNNRNAYREATITLFAKKMEELGDSGEILNARIVGVFGHEAQHDLDPIQIRAGLTGGGSNDIWHPDKNGNPKKKSPDYFEEKIIKQIERSKGITVPRY
jgi:RHS repeat-associated protein